MALYTRDGRPISDEDFREHYNPRSNDYRVISNPPPHCPACRRPHAIRAPHLGPPDSWAYEQVNKAPYREFSGEILALLDALNAPWKGRWTDKLAMAIHDKRPSLLHWLREGENQIEEDLTVCLAPAGSRAELLCGVAFLITSQSRQKIEARASLVALEAEALLLVGYTGLWLRVDYPLGGTLWSESYFHSRGAELSRKESAKSSRARKAAIIQSVQKATS